MSALPLSLPRPVRRRTRRLFTNKVVIGERRGRELHPDGALARYGENRLATPDAGLGHLVR